MKKETIAVNKQTPQPKGKIYIQKVIPAKGTTVVADPGGCRPTGT